MAWSKVKIMFIRGFKTILVYFHFFFKPYPYDYINQPNHKLKLSWL